MTLPALKSNRFTTEAGFNIATQVPGAHAKKVLETIYRVHPYEEPVLQVTSALRTLHVPGMDEVNPNKFWNRENEDWVPVIHQKPRNY